MTSGAAPDNFTLSNDATNTLYLPCIVIASQVNISEYLADSTPVHEVFVACFARAFRTTLLNPRINLPVFDKAY
jgi:hypothetical protein